MFLKPKQRTGQIYRIPGRLISKLAHVYPSRLLLALLILFQHLAPVVAQDEKDDTEKIRLTYLFSDGNVVGTLSAFSMLLRDNPELEAVVQLNFLTESLFESTDTQQLIASDILVLDMMNQQMLERYNEAHGVDLIQSIASEGHVLAVGVGILPIEHYTGQGATWDEIAMAYWQNGGQVNQLSLMKYALQQAGIEGLKIPPPQPSLDFGYYYPNEGGGQVFATWDEFSQWRQAFLQTVDAEEGLTKPVIAIGFYRSSFYGGETAVIDAIIREITSNGADAIAFFGYPGHIAFERMLLDEHGSARADAALSLLMRFANFESSQSLQKINIPVINLISLYGRSEQDWRDSDTGLSNFEGTFQVAVPELAGLIAPIVIGSRERQTDPATGLTMVVNKPVDSRITMAVKRALRYARLKKHNADKSIAIIYYNYPAGKSNIGASYLNIAESLSIILIKMRDEGYDLGDANLSASAILNEITEKARNVGGYAPGELEQLIKMNSVDKVHINDYKTWLDQLAPELRRKILADWGLPENARLMTSTDNGHKSFIIPRIRYGNIIIMPQPARAKSEDLEKLYHASDLAPHHQYVAVYAWLRNRANVDAIVHLGTHGTLEWLDGKDIGLTSEDAPDALIDEIPDIYIYNVDVVGEGLVARRRGMATLVDHMVPAFVVSELYPELAKLAESINNYDVNLHKNPELAQVFGAEIIQQVLKQGIDKNLGLELTGFERLDEETVHRIQDHLLEIKQVFIPWGLHAFGRLPDATMRASTVNAIVSIDRSLLPDQISVFNEEMQRRIIRSAANETDRLMIALNGGYIPGGTGGEPIRNPDAYPTGKNFYGIDPDKVPRRAAWKLGVKLADQMIAGHLKEHGEYPTKVSFVIWGDETMRHEGVLESQIFYLLGTRPVWDERDKVVGVEVVPRHLLGRPRIDIVIASAAEGMFNNVTILMDQAVQKVKAIDEADNFVRLHYLETRAALMNLGYSEADADQRAGVRIFDEPPGIHNLNTANIAVNSGSWDSDIGMANDYINKMGHGFGNGFWGQPMRETFKLALHGVDKVVHSSSTILYGALDNDDFFMYMGGLANAIKSIDGLAPELVVTNTRNPGKPEMTSIDKFIGIEFHSRYVNPNWIKGMQAEGYAGARNMVEFVEYMWGWDATVTDVIDDRMWQEAFDVYIKDKHDLDLFRFFDTTSPYAFQDILARMLETTRKQYWKPDDATKKELLEAYFNSVVNHGISCTEVSCGNPRLMNFVLEQGEITGIPSPHLETFRAAVEQAIKGDISQLAQVQQHFARTNEKRINESFIANSAPSPLQGFKMEPIQQQPEKQSGPGANDSLTRILSVLFQVAVLILLLGWWLIRRRRSAI